MIIIEVKLSAPYQQCRARFIYYRRLGELSQAPYMNSVGNGNFIYPLNFDFFLYIFIYSFNPP